MRFPLNPTGISVSQRNENLQKSIRMRPAGSAIDLRYTTDVGLLTLSDSPIFIAPERIRFQSNLERTSTGDL